ncbi:hypothetical protein GCM10028825_13100 [Spirosoma agri]
MSLLGVDRWVVFSGFARTFGLSFHVASTNETNLFHFFCQLSVPEWFAVDGKPGTIKDPGCYYGPGITFDPGNYH